MSFAELAHLAGRCAAFLAASVADDDAPVALLLDGDANFAAWFHGAALARRTVVPLNQRLTSSEIGQQLADARVGLLLG